MTRRRILRVVQAALAIVAVVGALGIVRAEVKDETRGAAAPTDVRQGEAAEIIVSKSDAPKELTGSFRLESVRDYPQLKAIVEHEETIARKGGRVVVAVINCDCPVNDDVLGPALLAVDANGREWEEFSSASPDYYAETKGLSSAWDLGEEDPFRYAAVFIVPSDVAGSVRIVLQRAGGQAYRFPR